MIEVQLYGGPIDGLIITIPEETKEVVVHTRNREATLFDLGKTVDETEHYYSPDKNSRFVYTKGRSGLHDERL